jgi:hypothetical protein
LNEGWSEFASRLAPSWSGRWLLVQPFWPL